VLRLTFRGGGRLRYPVSRCGSLSVDNAAWLAEYLRVRATAIASLLLTSNAQERGGSAGGQRNFSQESAENAEAEDGEEPSKKRPIRDVVTFIHCLDQGLLQVIALTLLSHLASWRRFTAALLTKISFAPTLTNA
ncbi:MAG TPA: hypothetical protein VK961_01955, partial [Chthoniobacter sp.]|nr:hypothetical protein [Chthoniobacter sp.]